MYFTREKSIKISLLAGIVVICVLILSVILNGVNQFKLGSQLAGINQVSNLSHLLVRQQAKLFSIMLTKNAKNDDLVEALDNFAQEDFVIDANLYASNGTLLAQSKDALESKPWLNQSSPQKETQQIVEPILVQENLVGFLRVTFDAQYGQTTRSKVDQLFSQLYGELIILFLAGGLLISSLYHFMRQKRPLAHHTTQRISTEIKRQTQRFHTRRRPFRRK